MNWAEYNASKVKPVKSYPKSTMKVWNKPEPPPPKDEVEVTEENTSDSMILRMKKSVMSFWNGGER